MTNVFEENGLSQQDVQKWQTEKNLGHLTDVALCQLYLRVVKGKSFRPPNPLFTVQEIWEKIDKMATGQMEKPAKNKIYVGIQDIDVVALIRDVTYTGCPTCNKSKKTLKKNHCTDHGDITPLEELHITEWAIFDGEDQFIMKLFAGLSPKYPEHLMVGAKAWVEGNIDITEDPISLTVNNFRKFEPGKLLGVGSFVEDEDEIEVDRSEVIIEGFEDDETDSSDPFKVEDAIDPFADEPTKTSRENGLSDEFIAEMREYMTEMLKGYASESSVPKSSVLRAMKTWVNENYPDEFQDLNASEGKMWEVIKGLYTDEADERVRYNKE